jgi:chitinase
MTYDFHSGLDTITGHHSNLYPSESQGSTNLSVIESVKLHVDAGVPAEKLVVGVPFYGRKWSGVPAENNGLYQRARSVGSIISYKKIVTELIPESGFQIHRDKSARAPYIYNKDQQIFISFEDRRSLTEKINWLKEKELGGVMFWEYAEDYNEELLNTIYTVLIE